jgi:hypothetical protein
MQLEGRGGDRPRRLGFYACWLLLFVCGCNTYIYTTREMTWDCVSGEPGRSGGATVRLRYVDAPAYFEIIESPGLCARLHASGRNRVTVRFDVWGSRWSGLRGYRIDEVDGQAVDPRDLLSGGSGREGEYPGSHPLADAFR